MATPTRRAASIRFVARVGLHLDSVDEHLHQLRRSGNLRLALGCSGLAAGGIDGARIAHLLDLAADHVDGVEDGDQVRDGVPFDQPRQRGEDGETGARTWMA